MLRDDPVRVFQLLKYITRYEERGHMELNYSDQELAALKKEHAANASEEQFRLWLADCRNRGLVPVRDVVLQIRATREWDEAERKRVYKQKAVYITTIGALRRIAQRTGEYAGQLPSQWVYLDAEGNPTIVSDVPLPDPKKQNLPRQPWAAKASVRRKGWEAPITVPARFGAYAQTYKDGDNVQLTSTWATRGPEQLEKCAEALALRKAFPEELGGLYIAEEMKDDPDTDFAVSPESPVSPPAETTAPKKTRKPKSSGSAVTQEPTVPAVPTAVPVSPSENIHGVVITDDDLPENLQPSPKPTVEQMNEIRAKLRDFSKTVGVDPLKAHILKSSGKSDTRDLTMKDWNAILDKLAKAVDEADLKVIVNA